MKRIGRAQLHHGRCEDVLADLQDESINAIVTDPPYECSTTVITRQGQKDLDSNFGDWDRFFTGWITEAYRILKPNSGMVVFVPATRFETLLGQCEKAGFRYVQPWFWHKTNPPVSMRNSLQWAVEHMLFVSKGSCKLRIKNRGKAHNIFSYPIPPDPRFHPTQKPVELMRDLIELVSDKDDWILDPFNGSGSTGVAAIANYRYYIGIEQDEKFFERTLNRLRKENHLD